MTIEQFDDAGLVWFAASVLGSAADKEGSLMALAAQRLEKVAQRLEELDAPANKEPANKGE